MKKTVLAALMLSMCFVVFGQEELSNMGKELASSVKSSEKQVKQTDMVMAMARARIFTKCRMDALNALSDKEYSNLEPQGFMEPPEKLIVFLMAHGKCECSKACAELNAKLKYTPDKYDNSYDTSTVAAMISVMTAIRYAPETGNKKYHDSVIGIGENAIKIAISLQEDDKIDADAVEKIKTAFFDVTLGDYDAGIMSGFHWASFQYYAPNNFNDSKKASVYLKTMAACINDAMYSGDNALSNDDRPKATYDRINNILRAATYIKQKASQQKGDEWKKVIADADAVQNSVRKTVVK